MNPEELAKYRVLAEENRKLRRLCEGLKAQNELLKRGQNAQSRAFDAENRELFAVIHENHLARATRIEVFTYGQSRRN